MFLNRQKNNQKNSGVSRDLLLAVQEYVSRNYQEADGDSGADGLAASRMQMSMISGAAMTQASEPDEASLPASKMGNDAVHVRKSVFHTAFPGKDQASLQTLTQDSLQPSVQAPAQSPDSVPARPSVQAQAQASPRRLDDLLRQMDETFSQMLLRLIDERGLKDSDVYHKANIDRRLFSKIRNDVNYTPTKKTVLAFAVALELSMDETRDLLLKAGYALSNSSRFDVIVSFFFETRRYNLFEINEVLMDYGEPLLCD